MKSLFRREDRGFARKADVALAFFRIHSSFIGSCLPPLWISSSLCINSAKFSMTSSKAGQGWLVARNHRWQPGQKAGQKCSLLQNSLKRGLPPGQLQVRLPLRRQPVLNLGELIANRGKRLQSRNRSGFPPTRDSRDEQRNQQDGTD